MSSLDKVWNHLCRKITKITLHAKEIFIPMPKAVKNSGCKEWKKLETIPAWQLEKVKSKKEVILEAQRDKRKVHPPALMDTCHLKNAVLETELQKYKGRVVLRWRH